MILDIVFQKILESFDIYFAELQFQVVLVPFPAALKQSLHLVSCIFLAFLVFFPLCFSLSQVLQLSVFSELWHLLASVVSLFQV